MGNPIEEDELEIYASDDDVTSGRDAQDMDAGEEHEIILELLKDTDPEGPEILSDGDKSMDDLDDETLSETVSAGRGEMETPPLDERQKQVLSHPQMESTLQESSALVITQGFEGHRSDEEDTESTEITVIQNTLPPSNPFERSSSEVISKRNAVLNRLRRSAPAKKDTHIAVPSIVSRDESLTGELQNNIQNMTITSRERRTHTICERSSNGISNTGSSDCIGEELVIKRERGDVGNFATFDEALALEHLLKLQRKTSAAAKHGEELLSPSGMKYVDLSRPHQIDEVAMRHKLKDIVKPKEAEINEKYEKWIAEIKLQWGKEIRKLHYKADDVIATLIHESGPVVSIKKEKTKLEQKFQDLRDTEQDPHRIREVSLKYSEDKKGINESRVRMGDWCNKTNQIIGEIADATVYKSSRALVKENEPFIYLNYKKDSKRRSNAPDTVTLLSSDDEVNSSTVSRLMPSRQHAKRQKVSAIQASSTPHPKTGNFRINGSGPIRKHRNPQRGMITDSSGASDYQPNQRPAPPRRSITVNPTFLKRLGEGLTRQNDYKKQDDETAEDSKFLILKEDSKFGDVDPRHIEPSTARYMGLYASDRFKKELLLVDIKASEVVYINYAVEKTAFEVFGAYDYIDRPDSPASACMVRFGNGKFIGVLSRDGIRLIQIKTVKGEVNFKPLAKWAIDFDVDKQFVRNSFNYVGLEQAVYDNTECLVTFNKKKTQLEYYGFSDDFRTWKHSEKKPLATVKLPHEFHACLYLTKSFDGNHLLMSINNMENPFVAKVTIDGELEVLWQENGKLFVPKRNIDMMAGVCETSDGVLLICDGNKSKIPSMGKVWAGLKPTQYGRQGKVVKVLLQNNHKVTSDVGRPVDIVTTGKQIFLCTHPVNYPDKRHNASVLAFQCPANLKTA